MATVTINGQEYPLLPLRSRQVVEVVLNKTEPGDQKTIVEQGLRGVAYSLLNGKSFDGQTVDQVADLVDQIPWAEYNAAWSTVLEITGLKKAAAGEAPAVDSTSSESAAE